MANPQLSCVEINPSATAIASVIWLHGLGADGNDFVDVIPQLNLPTTLPVRFVFPHAPVMPITINGGYPMRAWYDIVGMEMGSREDEKGILASAKMVEELISREQQLGIASDRIVLAGFSQGGAMALHCGLRFPGRLAGVLALSTYLPLAAKVAEEASAVNGSIPIFMAHGTEDPLIPLSWAEGSVTFLRNLNYAIDFRSYPMAHSMCMEEIKDIGGWLRKILM